jgi:N-acetylneuraminic acid mutarotase
MPEKRLAGVAVTVGDYMYVMGGTGGSQALLRYSPMENSWVRLAPTLQPREHTAAVAALDGKIYLLGGRWQSPGELSSIEIYDPENDSWTLGPPMAEVRSGFGAAVLGGKIFVLGGEIIISGLETLDSVEIFDPESGSWSFAPPMPFALHGVPAAVSDEALYVLGGADEAGTANNSGRTLVYGNW